MRHAGGLLAAKGPSRPSMHPSKQPATAPGRAPFCGLLFRSAVLGWHARGPNERPVAGATAERSLPQ